MLSQEGRGSYSLILLLFLLFLCHKFPVRGLDLHEVPPGIAQAYLGSLPQSLRKSSCPSGVTFALAGIFTQGRAELFRKTLRVGTCLITAPGCCGAILAG